MTRRTRMILIRAAVVVFLLYAVVNVVNLRTQIKSKRDELASLTLRVEEYQKANETLRQEMQSGISEEDIGEMAQMCIRDRDYDNIILPNGSFTANTDRSAGTFEPEYTFSRTYPNETIVTFTGGTITVAAEGDTFTITADLTDGQGNPYQYRYIGKVRVSDESPHHLPKITSNVDASFYLAEGTYFGDYYKNGTSLIDIGFTSADVFMSVEFL